MEQFSFKELEDCYLKATYPIEIGKKIIEPGEVIVKFDRIQIMGLKEDTIHVAATGGFNNAPRVFWEQTKDVILTFAQGVFSKEHLALAMNSKMVYKEVEEPILVTVTEEHESNDNSFFYLDHTPVGAVYTYIKETGEKRFNSVHDGNKVITGFPYENYIVYYTYNYTNGAEVLKMGQKLLSGFVELEGRTRVKDDVSGQMVTGILKIPKLRLMSDLSIRLGTQAGPVVANFSGIGVPVGDRGCSYVGEFYFLNNDLDSDF